MNILLVTAMFPPIRTGTSFYSQNAAEALSRRGNKVTVLTVKNADGEVDNAAFRIVRLPAIHLPMENFFKHFRISSFYPSNYLRVLRLVKETRPEAIFLVNHYLDIAFLAIVASLIYRIPLVVSVGTQLQSTNPRRDRILNFLDRLICGGIVFRFSKRIVSWDSQIHQYLVDVHDRKVTDKSVIVPYGVNGDPSDFMRHDHDYALKNQILGVGAVIEQRNFLFLIGVFKRLSEHKPDLKLKIVGHVYYDAAVKLAAELGLADRVTFTGELPHVEVLAEFKKSDLYFGITTGKYTGLGTATIESMLMGIPTISNAPTDLFGPPLLKDLENYIYTDGHSIDATAEKIAGLLEDKALRAKVGQEGRRFVSEYMDWDRVAAQMERVLAGKAEGTGEPN